MAFHANASRWGMRSKARGEWARLPAFEVLPRDSSGRAASRRRPVLIKSARIGWKLSGEARAPLEGGSGRPAMGFCSSGRSGLMWIRFLGSHDELSTYMVHE